LRIGIDYTIAVTGIAGVTRHARELVAALLEIDHVNEYLLIVTSDAKGDVASTLPRKVAIHKLPFSQWVGRIMWHRISLPLPLELFTGQLDVFHSPDFLLPHLRHAQGIVTIHDLAYMIYPQYTEPEIAKYFDKAVRRSLERARVVIAISEATKRDLVQLLGISEAKIEVIYNGVSARFFPVRDRDQLFDVQRRYGIDRPFILSAGGILSTGSIQLRKNLQRLVAAYSILRQNTKLTHQLLLTGGDPRLSEDLFRHGEGLDVKHDVRFLGYVPDEDLPSLICLADVFAFPSLYEGFGLPPLEAMACGTPVVSSNASAMPEVVGDAGILVDPLDVTALAEALRRSLLDDQLRTQLVERGLERSRRFTWEKTAQETLKLYEKVCRS